ncbi:hypothetical protein R3P38DRAFT_2808885 [Favolaschia claudopus]|uniref:Uncharacterized protein n=1 Tax=Favolaschia claudopus TaxID=2862362 RepID=A0AAV9ZER9_9AGAR
MALSPYPTPAPHTHHTRRDRHAASSLPAPVSTPMTYASKFTTGKMQSSTSEVEEQRRYKESGALDSLGNLPPTDPPLTSAARLQCVPRTTGLTRFSPHHYVSPPSESPISEVEGGRGISAGGGDSKIRAQQDLASASMGDRKKSTAHPRRDIRIYTANSDRHAHSRSHPIPPLSPTKPALTAPHRRTLVIRTHPDPCPSSFPTPDDICRGDQQRRTRQPRMKRELRFDVYASIASPSPASPALPAAHAIPRGHPNHQYERKGRRARGARVNDGAHRNDEKLPVQPGATASPPALLTYVPFSLSTRPSTKSSWGQANLVNSAGPTPHPDSSSSSSRLASLLTRTKLRTTLELVARVSFFLHLTRLEFRSHTRVLLFLQRTSFIDVCTTPALVSPRSAPLQPVTVLVAGAPPPLRAHDPDLSSTSPPSRSRTNQKQKVGGERYEYDGEKQKREVTDGAGRKSYMYDVTRSDDEEGETWAIMSRDGKICTAAKSVSGDERRRVANVPGYWRQFKVQDGAEAKQGSMAKLFHVAKRMEESRNLPETQSTVYPAPESKQCRAPKNLKTPAGKSSKLRARDFLGSGGIIATARYALESTMVAGCLGIGVVVVVVQSGVATVVNVRKEEGHVTQSHIKINLAPNVDHRFLDPPSSGLWSHKFRSINEDRGVWIRKPSPSIFL